MSTSVRDWIHLNTEHSSSTGAPPRATTHDEAPQPPSTSAAAGGTTGDRHRDGAYYSAQSIVIGQDLEAAERGERELTGPGGDTSASSNDRHVAVLEETTHPSELMSRGAVPVHFPGPPRPAPAMGPGVPGPRLSSGVDTEDMVVLTPTRVRVDSRMVLMHCTSNWISNCLLALFILFKLNETVDWSWWVVFLPTWVHHSINVPLQGAMLYFRRLLVQKHIGPPPPATSTPALRLQYDLLRRIRIKSHTMDALNALIDSTALLLVKVLLCYQLNEAEAGTVEWWSFRLVFLPFWLSWVLTTGLTFMKDKQERVFGSARDLQYIFFLFVACKLDGRSDYSWRIVFLVPWLWFAGIFLLASLVGTLLLLARFWRRFVELLLPFGFLSLLLACIPQFISYLALVRMLDELSRNGSSDITYEGVLLPNAASWFMMWAASLLLVIGLRQKEYVRERLLAAGHVWTAHESLATHLGSEAVESTQRQVDLMSDEEVALLVEEMMRGKTKPSMVVRVGESLYRILAGAESEGTVVMPVSDIESSESAPAAKQRGSSLSRQSVQAGSHSAGTHTSTLHDEIAAMRSSLETEPCGTEPGSGDVEMTVIPGLVSEQDGGVRTDASEEGASQVHPEPEEIGQTAGDEGRKGLSGGTTPAATGVNEDDTDDDLTCIICCDAPPTCVFLTCGHGGICRRCANLLFVRPPNECPTCRQKIEQVVELEQASKQVGDVLRVI